MGSSGWFRGVTPLLGVVACSATPQATWEPSEARPNAAPVHVLSGAAALAASAPALAHTVAPTPPPLPAWPASALKATTIDEFIERASPVLDALANRTADGCRRFAGNDALVLETSPAAGTWMVGDSSVLEVGAECAVKLATYQGKTEFIANERYATLRGTLRESTKFVTEFRESAGLKWRLQSPSLYSDEPHAVDIEIARQADVGSSARATVTVALPVCDCAHPPVDRQRATRRAYPRTALTTFDKGVSAALAKLESSCESASGSANLSSPAAGTDLATDPRVLGVIAHCQLGRADSAPMFATRPLFEAPASFEAMSEVAFGRVGASSVRVAMNQRKGVDLASITVERSTKRRRIHLALYVKASALPQPPR